MSFSSAFRAAIVIPVLMLSVHCAKKTKSQEVNVEVVPVKPIVFTANAKVGGIDAKAPWFSFEMKIGNLSTESILIVGVAAKSSIATAAGGIATSEVSFSPSTYDYIVAGSDPVVNCRMDTFGTYGPQGDGVAPVTLFASLVEGSSTDCANRDVTLVMGGLPSSGGSNYRYTIVVSPVGYFINSDLEPSDRFERSATFSTQ